MWLLLQNTTDHLSKPDISLLSRAKENISDEWWNVMLKEKRVACVQKRPQGGSSLACLGFPAMRSTLPRNAEFLIQRSKDPISGFQEAIDAPWRPVCPSCVEAKRTDWRRQRLKFWSKLDDWFELNEWEKWVHLISSYGRQGPCWYPFLFAVYNYTLCLEGYI